MRCATSSASTYFGKLSTSIGATMVERFDSVTTRSSPDSRISASRMGERDMPNRSARVVSSKSAPGSRTRDRISSCKVW